MSTPTPRTSVPSSAGVNRRDFVKTVAVAGAGLVAAAAAPSLLAQASVRPRRRYAIVGLGIRSRMYQDAIQQTYPEHAELVGICDTNPGRLQVAQRRSTAAKAAVPAAFAAADFDRMLRETRADAVVVTSMDSTHDEYIARALAAGVDVITEKPMTNTAAKCQRVLDATRASGRNLRVTFNYRYSPPRTQVKDILMSGEIGEVLSVDFHWLLNTHHGADYFRRWHSQKKFSEGLMLHKATHHFDLVNWWLGAVPETVWGVGKREFYTPATAKRMGLDSAHERCHTCPEKAKCGFFMDLAASPDLKELYLDQEHHDGYFRDQCVFRPEIDIEDTMNVMVRYDTGTTLSYSLNAFNSWEGYHIAFNGTKGRLEHQIVEQTYVSGTDTVQGGVASNGVTTRIVPLRGPARVIEPWSATGAHAGGDKVMLDEIFLPNPPSDKYLRASDQRGGAASILIGIAANRSFASGQPVRIADLVTGFTRPNYAPMPARNAPLPMPSVNSKPVS